MLTGDFHGDAKSAVVRYSNTFHFFLCQQSREFVLGDEDRVDAVWDRFANDINEEFSNLKEPELVLASAYLLNHPPRKRVLVNNRIAFVDQTIDVHQTRTQ